MTTIIDVNNIVKGIASTIGSPKVKGPNADPVKPIPAKITVTIVREIYPPSVIKSPCAKFPNLNIPNTKVKPIAPKE